MPEVLVSPKQGVVQGEAAAYRSVDTHHVRLGPKSLSNLNTVKRRPLCELGLLCVQM
jgi:hypothetical protein